MRVVRDDIVGGFGDAVGRWVKSSNKSNARDVYLSHLICSYKKTQYKKIANIVEGCGLDAQFTTDVVASLLFASGDFEAFNGFIGGLEVSAKSNLVRLLINSMDMARDDRFGLKWVLDSFRGIVDVMPHELSVA